MKKQILALGPIAMLITGLTACGSDADLGAVEDVVGPGTEQEIIVGNPAMNSVMMWPAGPITWTGTAGIWPIAVWSPMPIDFIAFDLAGATGLSLSLATLGAGGAFLPYPGISALPITTATFDLINAGLGVSPFIGAPLLPGTLGLGTFGASAALNTSLLLTPTITTNALMFNSLPVLTGMSPFIVNVGFNAASAASLASLNVFASSAAMSTSMAASQAAFAASTALPFTSTIFPITFMPSTVIF